MIHLPVVTMLLPIASTLAGLVKSHLPEAQVLANSVLQAGYALVRPALQATRFQLRRYRALVKSDLSTAECASLQAELANNNAWLATARSYEERLAELIRIRQAIQDSMYRYGKTQLGKQDTFDTAQIVRYITRAINDLKSQKKHWAALAQSATEIISAATQLKTTNETSKVRGRFARLMTKSRLRSMEHAMRCELAIGMEQQYKARQERASTLVSAPRVNERDIRKIAVLTRQINDNSSTDDLATASAKLVALTGRYQGLLQKFAIHQAEKASANSQTQLASLQQSTAALASKKRKFRKPTQRTLKHINDIKTKLLSESKPGVANQDTTYQALKALSVQVDACKQKIAEQHAVIDVASQKVQKILNDQATSFQQLQSTQNEKPATLAALATVQINLLKLQDKWAKRQSALQEMLKIIEEQMPVLQRISPNDVRHASVVALAAKKVAMEQELNQFSVLHASACATVKQAVLADVAGSKPEYAAVKIALTEQLRLIAAWQQELAARPRREIFSPATLMAQFGNLQTRSLALTEHMQTMRAVVEKIHLAKWYGCDSAGYVELDEMNTLVTQVCVAFNQTRDLLTRQLERSAVRYPNEVANFEASLVAMHAYELSMTARQLFVAMPRAEITELGRNGPNNAAYVANFSQVNRRVIDDVLSRTTVAERTQCLERWLRVAQYCHEHYQDTYTAYAINSAVKSSALGVLPQTLAGLSPEAKAFSARLAGMILKHGEHGGIVYVGSYKTKMTGAAEGANLFGGNGTSKVDAIADKLQRDQAAQRVFVRPHDNVIAQVLATQVNTSDAAEQASYLRAKSYQESVTPVDEKVETRSKSFSFSANVTFFGSRQKRSASDPVAPAEQKRLRLVRGS